MPPFTPIFAEIADKMPTVDEMWTLALAGGAFMAFVTFGLSLVRRWAGMIAVVFCLGIGVLASLPDDLDDSVLSELGAGYFWTQRALGFLPFLLALFVWFAVRLFQQRFRPP